MNKLVTMNLPSGEVVKTLMEIKLLSGESMYIDPSGVTGIKAGEADDTCVIYFNIPFLSSGLIVMGSVDSFIESIREVSKQS